VHYADALFFLSSVYFVTAFSWDEHADPGNVFEASQLVISVLDGSASPLSEVYRLNYELTVTIRV